ncbi:S-adenosyl-L-methionine-dependent methyltransferase [Gorgonomyces haynaldii]|nr:S-adenosyl-L-methionine-dependent methyltransferase [Gorgonomyces haynaldii]
MTKRDFEETRGDDDNLFRLRVSNLDKYSNAKDIKKWLTGLNIVFRNVKSAPKWDYAIVSFDQEEHRDTAFGQLANQVFKKKVVQVEHMNIRLRDNTKKPKLDDGRTPQERIQDQVTPLWRTPYEQQLKEKEDQMKKEIRRLHAELQKTTRSKRLSEEEIKERLNLSEELYWMKQAQKDNQGFICPVRDIVPSPALVGYRNKCEFTFGRNLNHEKALGFRLGLFENGLTQVESPQECLNVSAKAKEIVSVLERLCRESDLDVYSPTTKKGFWRLVLVRTMSTNQNMILVQINPTDVEQEQVDQLKLKIKDALVQECAEITSLYFQHFDGDFNGISQKETPELYHGSETITEKLLGLDFIISPFSFFQINTQATQVLYSLIRDLSLESKAKVEGGVVLLDLCCGTGTIGISLAKHVKKVIGVEMVESAIEDAKRNARHNQIDNIVFICDRVETAINKVLKEHVGENDQVIAILDPARAGLHKTVMQAIRAKEQLEHCIYVACDIKQSLGNIIDLCKPTSKVLRNRPFIPQLAVPVDLFPYTPGCELVVQLARDNSTRPAVSPVQEADVQQDPIVKQETQVKQESVVKQATNVKETGVKSEAIEEPRGKEEPTESQN